MRLMNSFLDQTHLYSRIVSKSVSDGEKPNEPGDG